MFPIERSKKSNKKSSIPLSSLQRTSRKRLKSNKKNTNKQFNATNFEKFSRKIH